MFKLFRGPLRNTHRCIKEDHPLIPCLNNVMHVDDTVSSLYINSVYIFSYSEFLKVFISFSSINIRTLI